jgi:F0F1-type ATP synthase assembly protein I
MVEIQKPPSSDRQYIIFALRIMGEISSLIAVPVVLFTLTGKWLDGRFNTGPKLLITGFVLAALLSGVMVWRRAKQLGQAYQALDEPSRQSEKKV